MERNPYSPPDAALDLPPPSDAPTRLVLTRFGNAMEAQVLKDLLVAEGIAASLGDAHTVQTNGLWATALGGVRVMVPGDSLAHARQLMEEMQSGVLALDGDVDPALPAPVVATERALWNIDLAAVFSLVLTPVFGGVLMLLNARTLGDARGTRAATAWLGVSIAVVGYTTWVIAARGQSPWLAVRASGLVAPYTLAWYLLGAHAQSSRIAKAHGRQYVHRSVLRATPLALLAIAAIGIASMTL